MGFYKRKAICFGPVRFNLSKTGIGVSVGRSGTGLAIGPRGTYVHMAGNALSYRQRLDAAGPVAISIENDLPERETAPTNNPEARGLAASSSREVLSQVNARASQTAHAPIIIALTVIALPVCAFFDPVAAAWVFTAGLGLAWLFNNGDKYKRTSDLVYHLADDARQQYVLMQSAFQTLARSNQIWLVQQESSAANRNRSAGTAGLIVRTAVKVRGGKPPWINTNVTVWTIDLGAVKLFFFPDRLLVWDSRRYRAVSYASLGVAFAPTRFMEDGKPPGDSEVIDRAWRYANKEGEPDPRYTSNTQLPVVLYGSVIFGAQNQLLAHLHVSNREVASRFAEVFRSSVEMAGPGHESDAAGSVAAKPGTQRQTTHHRPRTEARRVRVQGRVKWFNMEKGYGYITGHNGKDVLVLLPQILADGLRSLPEGSPVEFEIGRGPHGPVAVNLALMTSEQTWSGWHGKKSGGPTEQAPQPNPWEILGVQVGAAEDDVVAAYRRMAQMYHPDKVANLGPEFKDLADRKMREINAAYEALKRR